MIRSISLVVCLFAVLGTVLNASSSSLDLIFPDSLNVRDFGAVGDGITDDTRAIQQAFNMAFEMEGNRRMRLGLARGLTGGSRASAYPEIVFPEGTYLLSETIHSRFSNAVRGIGTVTLKQTDPGKDIIYFERAYRNIVENIGFEGGYIQIHLWTANNWARLIIRNCRFVDSNHYAIECRSFTEKRLEGEQWNRSQPWPPYLIEQHATGQRLVRNQSDRLEYWYNSTLIAVENGDFKNCRHAINIAADAAVVRNCRIDTHPEMEGAVMRMDGQAHLYGIEGMMRRNPELGQFWIEGEGNVSLRGANLVTDNEMGATVFRSYIPPTATTRGIRLENVRTHSAGSPDNAIIVVEPGTMPNIISLYNVEEISGDPLEAIVWRGGPDRDKLEEIKLYGNMPLEGQYKISFYKNSSSINQQLPVEFAGFLEEEPTQSLMEQTIVEPRIPDQLALLNDHDVVLLASDHGIAGDTQADQTAALQDLLDHASTYQKPLVILPGAAKLYISKLLEIPSNIRLYAPGVAFIIQRNHELGIFHNKNPEQLIFQNLDLVGGRNALTVGGNAVADSVISFDYCSFFDQQGTAVVVSLGDGSMYDLNNLHLSIRNSILRTEQGVVSNAAYNQIDTIWAFNDPHLNEAAFFENRGGQMRIETMLGNPHLWHGKRSKNVPKLPEGEEWPYSRHTRWIDNWGQLYCQDIRFGGESGGMCNIYNRDDGGTVHVSGGMTRFSNGSTRMAIVFVEAEPEAIVLRDISSFAGRVDGVSARIMAPDGSPADEVAMNLSVSGVLAP